MTHPHPRDPELARVAQLMVRVLDPLQRDQLAEALELPEDRHHLLALLLEALGTPEG